MSAPAKSDWRSRVPFDGFLLAMIAVIALATVLPPRGEAAVIVSHLVYGAVALLFFVYGIRLSREAVIEGLVHWRLQVLVLASTFVLFPLLGLGLVAAARPILPHALALGLLFVCVLPSTVQSSIAFTSIAKGNVPAALCSASISNLLGMAVTPALVVLLLRSHGSGLGLDGLRDIALQLLLPFIAGQLARPVALASIKRHTVLTTIVDRGSILLVVYAAFGESVVVGVWTKVTFGDLVVMLALDALILAIVLTLTTVVSRLARFSKEDEIAIVFCGSKKSLAAGIPMANILFGGGSVGLLILPLMLFHQLQLFVCAVLARRYARRAPLNPPPETFADNAEHIVATPARSRG